MGKLASPDVDTLVYQEFEQLSHSIVSKLALIVPESDEKMEILSQVSHKLAELRDSTIEQIP